MGTAQPSSLPPPTLKGSPSQADWFLRNWVWVILVALLTIVGVVSFALTEL
jgi:hypothetical protein